MLTADDYLFFVPASASSCPAVAPAQSGGFIGTTGQISVTLSAASSPYVMCVREGLLGTDPLTMHRHLTAVVSYRSPSPPGNPPSPSPSPPPPSPSPPPPSPSPPPPSPYAAAAVTFTAAALTHPTEPPAAALAAAALAAALPAAAAKSAAALALAAECAAPAPLRVTHAAALPAAAAADAAAHARRALHQHVRRSGARRLGGLPQPPQLLVRARDRGCRICNGRHLRGRRPGKHGEQ